MRYVRVATFVFSKNLRLQGYAGNQRKHGTHAFEAKVRRNSEKHSVFR